MIMRGTTPKGLSGAGLLTLLGLAVVIVPGYGLAVARAAVQRCGGALICCARADGRDGCEFRFTLLKAVQDPDFVDLFHLQIHP